MNQLAGQSTYYVNVPVIATYAERARQEEYKKKKTVKPNINYSAKERDDDKCDTEKQQQKNNNDARRNKRERKKAKNM